MPVQYQMQWFVDQSHRKRGNVCQRKLNFAAQQLSVQLLAAAFIQGQNGNLLLSFIFAPFEKHLNSALRILSRCHSATSELV